MVRSATLSQLPSVGISLGVSGSDVFHIITLFRNSLSIFWEFGVLAQYAKNRSMVMVEPLLLVMSMASSLGFGFVSTLSDTVPQIGSKGAMGVSVGLVVLVGVKIAV